MTNNDDRAAARVERAQELADEAAAHNEDETTRREALELELKDEGLSDAGSAIGGTAQSDRSHP